MDNTSSHRIQRRLAVVESEVPNFMGVKNGIYLTSNTGKTGNILFFEDESLKYKTRSGTFTLSNRVANLQGSILIGDEDTTESKINGIDNILIGRCIGESMTEGNDIIAIGSNTIKNSSALGSSIAIGSGSMGNCDKTDMNIAIGKDSLSDINDSYNIAIGIEAGKNMNGSPMNHNILVGHNSMSQVSGSSIDIISIGTEGCSKMSGINFKSIYIGDNVAQNLQSSVISINNIGIGSESLINAANISDVISIGSKAGNNLSGVQSISIGSRSTTDTIGTLHDEICIGTNSGSERKYDDSHNILIGLNSGIKGSGQELIAIGNNSGSELNGNCNITIGSKCGENLNGNENICAGNQAGDSLKGMHNVCIGSKAGYGLEGNRNIWIGEGPLFSDTLNNSVVIGGQIFVKGNEAVVIGSQVGKSSIGYLNRDILIGANAGMGQKYNESSEENSKGMLLIGANAGLGNIESPENINSSELLCIGHSAGHSNEQNFSKTLFIGNYAGSYANIASESVVIGHSAGVGMSGDSNIFIGSHAGFNVKGNKNILIGSHCGDQVGEMNAEFENLLVIGNSNRPSLLGDLENGNLLIGSTSIHQPLWTDSKGSLGFVSVQERPTNVSSKIGGVLYTIGHHLEYATNKRITNLTFPYKFISQGEMNGLKFSLNLETDGGTLLNFKIVPSSKPKFVLSEEIMLNVQSKKCIISRPQSSNQDWDITVANGILEIKCSESVKGICYLEAIGVHIVKEMK